MLRRLLLLTTLSILLSGCFIAPMALIGPATSGFTTTSIVQSGLSTTASYVVKKSTGKTIGQHAYDALSREILEQSYLPKKEKVEFTLKSIK